MKRVGFITLLVAAFIGFTAFSTSADKLVSNKTHIKFFSTTPAEDIEANNYASVSTITPSTGAVVFSVPMQGFEFEKAQMQKHFNNDKFLDTKKFPKAKLTAKIVNLDEVDFSTDGTYKAQVAGELSIKGVSKEIKEMGTVTVKGDEVSVMSKFNVTLADFGVSFKKGKPSTNVAKTVEVTVHAVYSAE